LQRSIECQGTHFDSVYTGGVRESTATYQSYLQVYQRTGESCPRCGHAIERIVVGGRGTHFCPECQRRRQS
jgi:formamidopyrimidine-DNA glycosylase